MLRRLTASHRCRERATADRCLPWMMPALSDAELAPGHSLGALKPSGGGDVWDHGARPSGSAGNTGDPGSDPGVPAIRIVSGEKR